MEKNITEKIFDSIHKSYDTFLRFATFKRIDHWQNEVIQNTPTGKFVVDIGTGTGEILRKVSYKNSQAFLIGIDLSINMLKYTQKKLEKNIVRPVLIKADALNMPFKHSTIDNLFFSLVFRHLPSEEVILEVKRVLKPGGYISIVDIVKPNSKLIYRLIYNFVDKIFRPVGRLIFSKPEWDYFVKSIQNSMTTKEMFKLFNENGLKPVYYKKRFFGLILIAVFQKEEHL